MIVCMIVIMLGLIGAPFNAYAAGSVGAHFDNLLLGTDADGLNDKRTSD